VVSGPEVLAGCPVFGAAAGEGLDRVRVVAAVARLATGSSAPLADLVSQLAHSLTLALDTLSQAFLPIFLGLGLLAHLAARRLTGRLDGLLAGAGALAGGALSVRVPVEGEDEVARLGTGFNAMADRLEESVSELRAGKAQVESLLRANRTLTASASHELRTPLAVMRAHLESAELRGAPLGPAEAEVLAAEVARLERLVEDLFALSRAELGRLEVRLEPLDVGEVTAGLLAALGPLAAASRVTLLQSLPAGLPKVRADRARLHQALLNLTQNALRYTPEGGLVMLEAECLDGGRAVELSVADTGIGIAAEDLGHVFEPFYRADPARTRETGGSGLGLALVSQLASAMGGTVRAESEPGRGSRFTLELPAWTGLAPARTLEPEPAGRGEGGRRRPG